MDQALQTPEILTRIMSFIHRSDTWSHQTPLARFARVNSTWRELVHRIIWTAPPAEALASIRRTRRHLYTPWIRRLDFLYNTDATLHTLFCDLPFPRLKKLTLGNPSTLDPFTDALVLDGWTLSTSQYFQPALEHLTLFSWDSICTASLFKEITEKCPGLKHIFLYGIGARLPPDVLPSLIEASHRLESLRLDLVPHSRRSVLINGDLVLRLSQIPKLDYLQILNTLDQPELFQVVEIKNQTPFQSLKKVALSATSNVISAAAQVLPNVVSLDLTLLDGDGAFLRDLKAIPNLRRLTIIGTQATSFPRDGLLALRHLNCLKMLTMVIPNLVGAGMVAPQFTDDDFDLMVSGMPDLKKIECDITWAPQSISVLSSLSKHCLKLETLKLDGPYDLQVLNNISKVMFPRLTNLTLEDAWVQGVPARLKAKQIGRLIDNHAPILKILDLRTNWHSHPVTKAWRTLRNLD